MKVLKQVKAIELKPGDEIQKFAGHTVGHYIGSVSHSPKGKIMVWGNWGTELILGRGLFPNEKVTIIVDDGRVEKDYDHEKLVAFFKEVSNLTLNHDELDDHAVVYPSKLGPALEKVDPLWWMQNDNGDLDPRPITPIDFSLEGDASTPPAPWDRFI